MPRIINSRCGPSGTMTHCSQIAPSSDWIAMGSVAVCSLANKVSSMVLLPLVCASTFAPSITPSSAARQERRRAMTILIQVGRLRAARRPVEQLDRGCDRDARAAGEQLAGVRNRNAGARGDVADAAEISGGDDVRSKALDVGDLAVAQAARQLGLHHLVGAGPAAAEMPCGHLLK